MKFLDKMDEKFQPHLPGFKSDYDYTFTRTQLPTVMIKQGVCRSAQVSPSMLYSCIFEMFCLVFRHHCNIIAIGPR